MPILIYAIAEFKNVQNQCLPPGDEPETPADRDLSGFTPMFNALAISQLSNPIPCAA